MLNAQKLSKKYPSKRLQEAYIFLKTITFDGDVEVLQDPDFLPIPQRLEVTPSYESLRDSYFDEDPGLSELLDHVSTSKHRRSPGLHQSMSVSAATNIEDELSMQRSVTVVNFDVPPKGIRPHKDPFPMLRSKSTADAQREDLDRLRHVDTAKFLAQPHKILRDRRVIMVSGHQVPVNCFSIMPYKFSDRNHSVIERYSSHVLPSGSFIEGVEMGDNKREVSYSHLLEKPSKRKHKNVDFTLGDDNENPPEPQQHVVVEYDPMVIDDPELTSGKHRTVLNLPSFMVSVIQYAKPSIVKKDINERFKEKFPSVTITLTKLRSIKKEMLAVATKLNLDPAVAACAFVYFEKLILKIRMTKHNRKCIAGACMLLSTKFYDDTTSKNIKPLFEAIQHQFRLDTKDLMVCEIQVLIALEFSLVTTINEMFPIFKRIETAIS